MTYAQVIHGVMGQWPRSVHVAIVRPIMRCGHIGDCEYIFWTTRNENL